MNEKIITVLSNYDLNFLIRGLLWKDSITKHFCLIVLFWNLI